MRYQTTLAATCDKEIITQIRNGEKKQFGIFVKKYKSLLMHAVIRITKDFSLSEDVVQDSFIKAYTKLHLFQGRSSFKNWLYRIAINTAINKLRGIKRESVNIDDITLTFDSKAFSNISNKELKKTFVDAIEDLPDKQKQAMKLRMFEDLSFKEISVKMDCPYDTAKANYRHGLLKLKTKFSDSADSL